MSLLHTIFFEDETSPNMRMRVCIYKFSLWAVGALALCDNLVTLRKQNLSEKWFGAFFWKTFKYLFFDPTIANSDNKMMKDHYEMKLKILTYLDVGSFISLNLMSWYIAYLKESYYPSSLIVFLLPAITEYGLKKIPWFQTFERPYTITHVQTTRASKISFPSTHTAVATLLIMQLPLSEYFYSRIFILLSVSLYRLISRAHTLDDVLAGSFFAYSFHHFISLL